MTLPPHGGVPQDVAAAGLPPVDPAPEDQTPEDQTPEDLAAGVPAEGRILFLLTSPRTAPGLLTWRAWDALRRAESVLAADVEPAWQAALAEAGVHPVDVAELPVAQRAGRLVEGADGGRLVAWLGSPDGDPGLTDLLAQHLSRRSIAGAPPEVEVLAGSHDVAGSRLLDLVAVMDRLRSPGGCPWDARQSHASLLPYLLEEAHEVIEAVELGDRAHLREELGDLLLQVVFHARVAEEDAEDPFDVDDVAAGIVAKLVHRHPHVFGDGEAATAEDVERTWDSLKAAEKRRAGLFEGIPATLPALAKAQKMLSRLDKAGGVDPGMLAAAAQGGLAADLLDVVRRAGEQGEDAEGLLRAALARLAASAG